MSEFIGIKLKTLREEAGTTLEQLAENSGINAEMLREIENNEVTPSLNTARRICEAMDIRIGTLLDGSDESPVSIVRRDEGHRCNSHTTDDPIHSQNLSYKALTTKTNRMMDPYQIIVSDEPLDMDALQSHDGEEFIYVLEGRIEFYYGAQKTELETGDSLYFDSLIPHCMRALTKGGSKVLSIHYRI